MYLLANVSKKVSVVKVESVHPLDESIRFWDERIQDWTYLWPEDFVLVPPDSVETAIALDTESKPEPQFLDAVSYYASKSNTKTGRMPIPQEAHKN